MNSEFSDFTSLEIEYTVARLAAHDAWDQHRATAANETVTEGPQPPHHIQLTRLRESAIDYLRSNDRALVIAREEISKGYNGGPLSLYEASGLSEEGLRAAADSAANYNAGTRPPAYAYSEEYLPAYVPAVQGPSTGGQAPTALPPAYDAASAPSNSIPRQALAFPVPPEQISAEAGTRQPSPGQSARSYQQQTGQSQGQRSASPRRR